MPKRLITSCREHCGASSCVSRGVEVLQLPSSRRHAMSTVQARLVEQIAKLSESELASHMDRYGTESAEEEV